MRYGFTLLAILASASFTAAVAEDIVFPPKDICCWPKRTTEIDILRVPDLKQKNLPATLEWKLTAWEQGLCQDSSGRWWILIRGPMVSGTPTTLLGWQLRSVYNHEFFYTTSGALFGLAPKCPPPACKNLACKTAPAWRTQKAILELWFGIR